MNISVVQFFSRRDSCISTHGLGPNILNNHCTRAWFRQSLLHPSVKPHSQWPDLLWCAVVRRMSQLQLSPMRRVQHLLSPLAPRNEDICGPTVANTFTCQREEASWSPKLAKANVSTASSHPPAVYTRDVPPERSQLTWSTIPRWAEPPTCCRSIASASGAREPPTETARNQRHSDEIKRTPSGTQPSPLLRRLANWNSFDALVHVAATPAVEICLRKYPFQGFLTRLSYERHGHSPAAWAQFLSLGRFLLLLHIPKNIENFASLSRVIQTRVYWLWLSQIRVRERTFQPRCTTTDRSHGFHSDPKHPKPRRQFGRHFSAHQKAAEGIAVVGDWHASASVSLADAAWGTRRTRGIEISTVPWLTHVSLYSGLDSKHLTWTFSATSHARALPGSSATLLVSMLGFHCHLQRETSAWKLSSKATEAFIPVTHAAKWNTLHGERGANASVR